MVNAAGTLFVQEARFSWVFAFDLYTLTMLVAALTTLLQRRACAALGQAQEPHLRA